MKFLTPSLDPYFTTESKSKSDPMHLSVLLDREEGMVVSFQDPIGLHKKKTFIFHIDQKVEENFSYNTTFTCIIVQR